MAGFLSSDQSSQVGALQLEKFRSFGLVAVGLFERAGDDVAAVFIHGIMVGQVKVGQVAAVFGA